MTALTCVSCGQTDGVVNPETGSPGAVVDTDPSWPGPLCLYCQPCPGCLRVGTGCDSDDVAPGDTSRCDPKEGAA